MDWPLARHGARPAQGGGLCYYPGFHQPGLGVAVGINIGVWESFDASDRRVFEAVAACEYARAVRVQRQQRTVAAKIAGRRHPKILKLTNPVEGPSRDQQGCRRRDQAGDDFPKKSTQLPTVPRIDHQIERYCGTRLPQRPQACFMDKVCPPSSWQIARNKAGHDVRRRDVLAGAGSLAAGASLTFRRPQSRRDFGS